MPLIYRLSILVIIFVFWENSTCFSQEVIDGPDGKKIILYADGTWEPYGEEGERAAFTPDSLELEKNLGEFRKAQQLQKELSLTLIKKRLEVAQMKSELSELEAKKGAAEQVVFDLRNKIKIAEQRMTELDKSLENAKAWTELMERVVYLSSGFRQKTIDIWKKNNEMVSENDFRQKTYAQYSAEIDVMLNPPETPCEYIFSGMDAGLGKKRQDLRPEILFTFTDPGLESYFVKQDLIVGRVYITSLSAGRQMMNLEIAIASRRAPNLFGGIKPNDFILVKTLDGQRLKLLNQNFDGGKWDELRQAYVYQIQYPIGAKEFRVLSKSELDTVEVRWSNVKEEYEVLDVDVLKRQLACLVGS